MESRSEEKNRSVGVDKLNVRLRLVRRARAIVDPVEVQVQVNDEPLLDRFPYKLRGLTSAELPPSRHFFGDAAERLSVEGRVALLVCPLCGDLGCGAVMARITVANDEIRWSDFIHGVNWVPSEDTPFEYTFVFERAAYELSLAEAAQAARGMA